MSRTFFVERKDKMKILKGLSRREFREQFGTEEQCLVFLSRLKWGDNYSCFKCENKKYGSGKKVHNRRCTRCGYDESPTANTLFQKQKFKKFMECLNEIK